jgi:hypothetical protein
LFLPDWKTQINAPRSTGFGALTKTKLLHAQRRRAPGMPSLILAGRPITPHTARSRRLNVMRKMAGSITGPRWYGQSAGIAAVHKDVKAKKENPRAATVDRKQSTSVGESIRASYFVYSLVYELLLQINSSMISRRPIAVHSALG